MLNSPAAGYDLKQEFAQGARHFWSAELGQIYPTLAALEKKGWLKSRREPSPKGPQRRVYRRTAQGDRELARWLSGEPIMGTERFAYLAQLIFMGQLHDLARTQQFLRQLRDKQAALLNVIQQGLDEIAPSPHSTADNSTPHKNLAPESLSDEAFHEWLCLRLSARAVGARVQWCDEALEIVLRRASQPKKKGRAHD